MEHLQRLAMSLSLELLDLKLQLEVNAVKLEVN